jgi:hypothetical protein
MRTLKTWEKIAIGGGAAVAGISLLALAFGQNKQQYSVLVGSIGNGHYSVENIDNPTTALYYSSGTTITLTAYPDSGNKVNGWTVNGDSLGATNSIKIYMDEDKTVGLSFVPGVNDGSEPGNPAVPPTLISVASDQLLNWKQKYVGGFDENNRFRAKAVLEYANHADPFTYEYRDVRFLVKGGLTNQQPAANAKITVAAMPVPDVVGGAIFFSTRTNNIEVIADSEGYASTRIWYVMTDMNQLCKRAYITYISGVFPWVTSLSNGQSKPAGVSYWHKLHTNVMVIDPPVNRISPTASEEARGAVEVSLNPTVHQITASYLGNSNVQPATIQAQCEFLWNVLPYPELLLTPPLPKPNCPIGFYYDETAQACIHLSQRP